MTHQRSSANIDAMCAQIFQTFHFGIEVEPAVTHEPCLRDGKEEPAAALPVKTM